MSAVPLKEVIEALRFSHLHNKRKLALRIEQHGIAPPDGFIQLQAFARECFNVCFEGGDLDGATIQEMGVKYGLLAPTAMNAPCNGGDPDKPCACADFCDSKDFESGVTCYRYTNAMLAAAPEVSNEP